MEAHTEFSPGVFIGLTVIVMGFAAYMTGYGLAKTWRPMWQALIYAALLGAANRFLAFALFDADLLSPIGYVIDTGVLTMITLVAYRLVQARKMVSQYPWLYELKGPFSWRDKRES